MASWVCALQCGLALSWCKINVFLFRPDSADAFLEWTQGCTIPVGIHLWSFSQKFRVKHALLSQKLVSLIFFFADGIVLNILHSENVNDDIPWIAFCFPGYNDEPRIRLQWQYSVSKALSSIAALYKKSVEVLITNEHYCLSLRRLMSYIHGAPILDVSRSHTTTQHSR